MIALLEYLFLTSMVVSLFPIAIMLFKIVAYWFLFEKAGEDGWKALVPFYNSYVLCKISKKRKTVLVGIRSLRDSIDFSASD